MRVIAGKARRIPLVTVKGMETRPTTDRTKETLFNMIAHGLCDCTFLDLFSGSGAIGIEAISRGVKKAVFVENNPNAIQCIMENLKKTQLEDQAEVIRELCVFGTSQAGWKRKIRLCVYGSTVQPYAGKRGAYLSCKIRLAGKGCTDHRGSIFGD